MPAAMTIRRRALPLLALAAVGTPALAETVDLSVTCDTTLAPALRKAAAAYRAQSGVRVFVFPTGPGLILPQLVRDIQNDIVVTQTGILDQAVQAGVVAVAVRPQWRNPLVIAGLRDEAAMTGTSPHLIQLRRRISMERPSWRASTSSPLALSVLSIPMRWHSS